MHMIPGHKTHHIFTYLFTFPEPTWDTNLIKMTEQNTHTDFSGTSDKVHRKQNNSDQEQ